MAVITYDDGQVETIGTAEPTTSKPGHGRSGPPLMSTPGKSTKIVTGILAFDASYPTGGEDISRIFNLFADFGQAGAQGAGRTKVIFEQPLSGAQTGKFAKVDYVNRKVQLFTNASPAVEVVNASDQSAITALPFIAVGPR
jgi:hypothetical protein